MHKSISEERTLAGSFETVAATDQAIRALLAAGIAEDQLLVVCPARFRHLLGPWTPEVRGLAADSGEVIAEGGVVGATIGGLALVATMLTGGAAGIVAAALIGGGAIAGGFSNLIVSKGYETEADDYINEAVQRGWIVVGVAVRDADDDRKLREVERVLQRAGAKPLGPVQRQREWQYSASP